MLWNIRLNGKRYTSANEIESQEDETVTNFLKEWYNNEDYVTGHTSGSTGTPKELHLLKRDMIASAELTNRFFHIGTSSNLLLCLSPSYIAGKMMIVRAILSGANLHTVPPLLFPPRDIRHAFRPCGNGSHASRNNPEIPKHETTFHTSSTNSYRWCGYISKTGKTTTILLDKLLRHLRYDRNSFPRGPAPHQRTPAKLILLCPGRRSFLARQTRLPHHPCPTFTRPTIHNQRSCHPSHANPIRMARPGR